MSSSANGPPAREPSPGAKATLGLTPQFWRNFAAVAVAGILSSFWLRAVTDSFEIVASFVGLSGAFSWAAVVWAAAGEERQKAFRGWVVGAFASPWVERGALAALVAGTAASIFVGSIRVENGPDGEVMVGVGVDEGATPATHPDDFEPLARGAARNHPCLVWPWSRRAQTVKVGGLPAKTMAVRPWWWWRVFGPERVFVPASFLRPVLLVGAPAGVASAAAAPGAKYEIEIEVVGRDPYVDEWQGQSVLVGADDKDLPLPEGLKAIEEWKPIFADLANLRRQFPAKGLGIALAPGDLVQVRIFNRDGQQRTLIAKAAISVFLPADRSALVVAVMPKEDEKR